MLLLLWLMDSAAIADISGVLSIGFWLCAQLPQVIKNWQLGSCDGLSLPFLVTWLFGDLTNFIGCVLTDQLPFQTYLAFYFCLVDLCLVSQFYYYRPKTLTRHDHVCASPHTSQILPSPVAKRSRSHVRIHGLPAPSSPVAPHSQLSAAAAAAAAAVAAGGSGAGTGAGHPNSLSLNLGRGRRRPPPAPSGSFAHGPGPETPFLPRTDSAEALYAAAIDVALAAERVSARRSRSSRPGLPRHAATLPPARSPARSAPPSNLGDDTHLRESFHSSTSLHSASTDDDDSHHRPYPHMTMSTPALHALAGDRGRTLTRNSTLASLAAATPPGERADQLDPLPDYGGLEVRRRPPSRSHSRSQSQARVRGSGRRAATVAFMGLGVLFLRAAPHALPLAAITASDGQVVPKPAPRHPAPAPWPSLHPPLHSLPLRQRDLWVTFPADPGPGGGDGGGGGGGPRAGNPHPGPAPTDPDDDDDDDDDDDGPPRKPPREPISLEELIGRISAWCCTTLYLSSRLPQIWKNFQRKSVEGLSIFLFLFAFCGNVTYVVSIVVRPAPPGEGAHYLFKALPYLLGSGGTLMFDLTIMLQSVLYGSAPPVPETPVPRRAYTYAGLPAAAAARRRRHETWGGHAHAYAEEGLGVSVASLPPERRPLLLSSPAARPRSVDSFGPGSAAAAAPPVTLPSISVQTHSGPSAEGGGSASGPSHATFVPPFVPSSVPVPVAARDADDGAVDGGDANGDGRSSIYGSPTKVSGSPTEK